MSEMGKSDRAAAEHVTDYTPAIYNIWKKQKKSGTLYHFGNSEITWVDHLLYRYTEPFDVVVDPFAGSGSTAELCKKRFRRYWVSDRKVEPELKDRIREHDLVADDGSVRLPAVHNWSEVSLVYLDPPYWKQAAGQYSDDVSDLANMSADRFHEVLAGVVNGFAAKLHQGAHIALIIQPTQWAAPDRTPVDHVLEMARRVDKRVVHRISVPYESQQYTPQMVEWAKENRDWLVLTRELVVWRV